MNKKEIIEKIADEAGLTQKDTGKFLDSFVETVTEAMSKDDDVALVGFGTFSVVERAARIARNFKTKEVINVPKSKTVRFKAGKKLKDAVKL